MSNTKTSQHLALVDQTLSYAIASNIIHLYSEDQKLDGRIITTNGKELINFGSCSYLGLETDERLKAGAIDAINRYGTQFSSSRAYMSLSLYKDLEIELENIFAGSVMVSPTTTLGHLAAIPVIVGDNDAIILDHQVHASVQMATQLLRPRGIKVDLIRHNRMDQLEHKIKKLQKKHDKVWYFADGIYSMFGDYAPIEELNELLNRYPSFHLYIDDAHGIGWCGQKGQGVANTFMGGQEKVYIAASFAKSFGTGGGAIIFPNKKIHQTVRKCGSTITFSGPIQPPTLGATIASAKLHQSSALEPLQESLRDKIALFNREAAIKGLEQPVPTDTPICYIRIGDTSTTFEVIQRVMAHGYYVNTAIYPSVPYKDAGIRITINNHLRNEDITGLLSCIRHEIDMVSKEMKSEKESLFDSKKFII
ncbi:MAG: aminotransferase class I/II-fold pyridoxal phosphate-dependent enzyme [Bacteroidia bacterium]|nr:aminotransferase class I/II-fold pyridoxal phosphate-dependent enzyme [Bacteroidia bacterium]